MLLGFLLAAPVQAFDKQSYIENVNSHVDSDRVLDVLSVAKEYNTKDLDMELLMFFLAEQETTFDMFSIGSVGEEGFPQINPRWHKKALKDAGLVWGNQKHFVIYACVMISTSMKKGKSLYQALYPWKNTRKRALRNYYKYKD
jgi:hypothetical protein